MANIKKDFASPNGPILLLSAKGSTTASIAEANGVKDFSGNENHGQAYGGLSISNNADGFDFDGANDYINIAGSRFSSINGVEGVTLFCRFKCSSSIADGTRNLVTISLNGSSIGLAMRIAVADGVVKLSYGGRSHDTNQSAKMNSPSATLNKEQWYSCAVVASTANHICTAYIDGDTFASITTWHTDPFVTPNSVKIGSQSGSNNFFNGSISDIRIYPRALSANEVKYLHGGFQPSLIMGQAIPSGAILDLSARGLTTAGIVQANGVVDRSGNGNHGQAYGNVTVAYDEDMGTCFNFDGVNGYISFNSNIVNSAIVNNSLTVFACFKIFALESLNMHLASFYYTNKAGAGLHIETNNKPGAFSRNSSSASSASYAQSTTELISNTVYTAASIVDYTLGKLYLYINGSLVKATDIETGTIEAYAGFNIGRFGSENSRFYFNGLLKDVRIYSRALSASEVKKLSDASLKKIQSVTLGNNTIKHIYYGGHLVYAETADYVLKTVKENKTTALDSSATDLWGVCKIRSTGDYVLACGNANIIKVYDGTTGNFKFSTSMVNTNALKYDVCPGREDDVIYLSEHITNASSGSKIRKLRYTGTGFTEITNADIGSGHGITYDHANNRIVGANYYGSRIRAFSDDDDTTEMTQVLNISAPYYVANVKVTSDGRYIYYTCYNSVYLGRYDTSTGSINNNFIKMVDSGNGWSITGFALSDDEKKIVFVNNPNQCIKVLDLETGQITAIIDDSDSYTLRISNIGNNVFLYVAWDKGAVLPKYIIERDLSPYLT